MLESKYQNKIIKSIEALGGVVVNGNYSKAGEADLQCGYPLELKSYIAADELYTYPRFQRLKLLVHIAVEVKTEKDYHRVMRCINSDYTLNGKTGLKEHEPLQMAKIRRNRAKGGLALVAYSFEQVQEYVNATTN